MASIILNTTWRFIDTSSLTAHENMELDESLLQSNEPIFRLYTWKSSSFTIGRSQKIENIKDAKKFGDNWAQRMTGGGLLLHGFDVSYTIIVPTKLLGNRNVKESYEYLCGFLLNFYKKLGLHVEYAKDCLASSLSKSIFCQDGFEPYDMIIKGKKIGGNAQRRTKNFIHQHGSIPLRNDNRKFAGHSLEEFGITITEKETKELLKQSFMDVFDAKFYEKKEL